MNRIAILLSSSLGLAAIYRAGAFYAGTDSLAMSLVCLMAFVLVAATVELALRAGRADALHDELAALPSPLSVDVVGKASAPLRSLLRARIEHVAMPASAPSFAPYVVGLLVMLGLLGTFLGLFETLRGAREALGSSTDVDALRAGLARPMAGLTRSFGTSAAGVSASAALGLATVFARRSEARLLRALQACTAGPLAALTIPHRTLAALEALVAQGEALPRAAASLEDATRKLEQLEAAWRDGHRAAAGETSKAIAEASASVGESIAAAVALVGPAARDVVTPLATEMLARATGGLEAHATRLADAEKERAAALAAHWAELTQSMGESARTVHAAARATIAQGQDQLGALVLRHETLGTRVEALVTGVAEVTAASVRAAEEQGSRLTAHAEALGAELAKTSRVVAESAELLRAGGGELGAVAEAFGVAADRHRDASMAWLESLGAIDDAVAEAGERAGAGVLSETLARMHEVFERQVQIELELFTQLRALRGLPPAQIAQEHGRKTDAPA